MEVNLPQTISLSKNEIYRGTRPNVFSRGITEREIARDKTTDISVNLPLTIELSGNEIIKGLDSVQTDSNPIPVPGYRRIGNAFNFIQPELIFGSIGLIGALAQKQLYPAEAEVSPFTQDYISKEEEDVEEEEEEDVEEDDEIEESEMKLAEVPNYTINTSFFQSKSTLSQHTILPDETTLRQTKEEQVINSTKARLFSYKTYENIESKLSRENIINFNIIRMNTSI
jgi:hypothetical protein